MQPSGPVEELRVPKRRVRVEVVLPGGAARHVSLFLAEASADHEGPERPSDLLNGRDGFIPALDEDSGAMTFLHRSPSSQRRGARAACGRSGRPTHARTGGRLRTPIAPAGEMKFV